MSDDFVCDDHRWEMTFRDGYAVIHGVNVPVYHNAPYRSSNNYTMYTTTVWARKYKDAQGREHFYASCNCPGWATSRKRSCKHTTALLEIVSLPNFDPESEAVARNTTPAEEAPASRQRRRKGPSPAPEASKRTLDLED